MTTTQEKAFFLFSLCLEPTPYLTLAVWLSASCWSAFNSTSELSAMNEVFNFINDYAGYLLCLKFIELVQPPSRRASLEIGEIFELESEQKTDSHNYILALAS